MKTILTFLLACFCLNALAQTPLSGGVYSNTTLALANSPYELTGDLVVFTGVKLTIEPGVEIRVDQDKKIEVRGQISAIGTASKPINIHGNSPSNSKNFWTGIVFIATDAPLGSGSQADFNYCNVSDASVALDMDLAYHGPYSFRNCVFSYNGQTNRDGGMGGVTFDHCTFRKNGLGLGGFQFGGTVFYCLFDGNTNGAMGIENLIGCKFINHTGTAVMPGGSMIICEVYNNNIGVECYFNSTNNTFKNNKIKNNSVGVRILSYFNGSITFTGNEICDNTNNNIELNTTNNADLSNNCWCLTDATAISQKILDGYKDVSRGLVNFAPFNSNCNNEVTTGTPTLQTSTAEISVSPNPSMGNTIKVSWKGIQDKSIHLQVRNISGQIVPFEKTNTGAGFAELITDAAAGIYFVSATDLATGATATKQIVIQK